MNLTGTDEDSMIVGLGLSETEINYYKSLELHFIRHLKEKAKNNNANPIIIEWFEEQEKKCKS